MKALCSNFVFFCVWQLVLKWKHCVQLLSSSCVFQHVLEWKHCAETLSSSCVCDCSALCVSHYLFKLFGIYQPSPCLQSEWGRSSVNFLTALFLAEKALFSLPLSLVTLLSLRVFCVPLNIKKPRPRGWKTEARNTAFIYFSWSLVQENPSN